jgi:hypothetical protein
MSQNQKSTWECQQVRYVTKSEKHMGVSAGALCHKIRKAHGSVSRCVMSQNQKSTWECQQVRYVTNMKACFVLLWAAQALFLCIEERHYWSLAYMMNHISITYVPSEHITPHPQVLAATYCAGGSQFNQSEHSTGHVSRQPIVQSNTHRLESQDLVSVVI